MENESNTVEIQGHTLKTSTLEISHISIAVSPSPCSSGYNSEADVKSNVPRTSVVKFADLSSSSGDQVPNNANVTKERGEKTLKNRKSGRLSTSALKIPDLSTLEFVAPDEGTPAAEALAGEFAILIIIIRDALYHFLK